MNHVAIAAHGRLSADCLPTFGADRPAVVIVFVCQRPDSVKKFAGPADERPGFSNGLLARESTPAFNVDEIPVKEDDVSAIGDHSTALRTLRQSAFHRPATGAETISLAQP